MTSPTSDLPPVDETAPPPERAWRRRKPWGMLLVAVLTLAVGGAFALRLGQDPANVASPLIGRAAPTERLPNLEGGGELSLADLRGRVVVVNFWASWCPACREEQSALTAAAAAYRDAGVVFVGIVYQDNRPDAIRFLDELGRGKGYRYVLDSDSRAAIDFGVFGVPETFVVDPDGRIAAKITGKASYPLLAQTLDAVLAGQRPGAQVGGELWRDRGGPD